VPVLAHFHSARLVRCGTEWRVPRQDFKIHVLRANTCNRD
jgi:hypothetical protein